MNPQTAWLLGLALMALVFLYFHHKTRDIRHAFIAALVWARS